MNMSLVKRRRLGWWLVGLGSAVGLLLPSTFTPAGITPGVWLAIMLTMIILPTLALIIGGIFLLLGYQEFFRRPVGLITLVVAFVIVLRIVNPLIEQAERPWPLSQIFLLAAFYFLALTMILFFALIFYLWHRDHAVQLFAITALLSVWALAIYVRIHGPDQTLVDALLGRFPSELIALLCIGNFVVILTPIFFVIHVLRVVSQEFDRRGDPLDAKLSKFQEEPS